MVIILFILSIYFFFSGLYINYAGVTTLDQILAGLDLLIGAVLLVGAAIVEALGRKKKGQQYSQTKNNAFPGGL